MEPSESKDRSDDELFEGYSTFEVLEELIGANLARRFCNRYGGKLMYIPFSAEKADWLVQALGYEAAEEICKYYRIGSSGSWLLVPIGYRHHTSLPDVAKMMDDNVSIRDCATALGVHVRTIARARKEINDMRAKRLKGRIDKLRSEGWLAPRIANELNISEVSLKAIIRVLDADKERAPEAQRANRKARG